MNNTAANDGDARANTDGDARVNTDDARANTDDARVDADDDASLHRYAAKFGVTAEEVREAVLAVGAKAQDVQDFLEGGGNRVP